MDRPSPEEVLASLVEKGTLNAKQVQTAAIDLLSFVIKSQDEGGKLAVMHPDGRIQPYNVVVPGLTMARLDE